MRREEAAVHLTLHDEPAPTRALRAALDDLAPRYGLAPEELFDLKVAATEALTNAIKGSSPGEPVDVAVGRAGDAVEIEVSNHGTFRFGDPAHVEVESERGRGIPLMFALVDEIEFAATVEGTRVRMRKRVARELVS
jgi:anti-sigma regulatory factor (Ser/Thr protein kinase)